ncbi:MAG: quinone-dependent dihydroorotate dehydrogenase [Saprospiraceae bacterium]|nr:quinone-dependent dihydroorotate dehydrogenase [Saprospiraceae bacterium]
MYLSNMYKSLLKPFFFYLPPERAHHLALRLFGMALRLPLLGGWLRSAYRFSDSGLERKLLGLTFANPVGLAAGFDKDGKYMDELKTLGFGFMEVGTVTPRPQAGNPKPRLFRLPADEALINRMGFNNEGLSALVTRLKKRPRHLIVGGNIGKNKDTPNERAVEDYLQCFESLFPYVDYFVVNVSSPNTPGLRSLQGREPLTRLLTAVQEQNRKKAVPKPVLLKIAPDLNQPQLDDILEITRVTELDGIIATNTTISREGLNTRDSRIREIGPGGLSGTPLRKTSTDIIRYLRRRSKKSLVIIGVGGISSPRDALEKLEAGADLVQLYTGMIYEGPGIVKRIKKGILAGAATPAGGK